MMVNRQNWKISCFKMGQILTCGLLGGWMLVSSMAVAQQRQAPVPGLFDQTTQENPPDLANLRPIRFLTESDYPPLHFNRSDGELAGFNVDLAREICLELKLQCTVQPWRWDKLNEALANNAGDAIIASQRPAPELAATQIFSVPYYVTPARFIGLKGAGIAEISAKSLSEKTIGVLAGSAHEAYLKAAFPTVKRAAFFTLAEAESALVSGKFDLLLGDGLTLSLWLAQDQGSGCAFVGSAYFDNGFFGEGARIAFRQDNEALRVAVNYALRRLSARGVLSELTWKYFPISFY